MARALDEAYKLSYLPIAEAMPWYARLEDAGGDALVFIPLPMNRWDRLAASVRTFHLSQARLDRRIAALRVVEAIRLHAAGNGGALPDSLDAITAVPVPIDPISGEPFSYDLGGTSALLEAPEVPVPVPPPGASFRIVARKRPQGP